MIYEKKIDTRSFAQGSSGRLLNFSQFEDRLPDFKVYHVVIRSTEDYWVKKKLSRFISLSDLGLIAKEGKDKAVCVANSIRVCWSC